MKNLLEIAKVLTRNKIAKIEILDEQVLKQKDSKFGKFYEGLLTGKIESDADASSILYKNNKASDAKYRQLKSRFRRRLLNTLFFVDINTPLASNYDQAHFNCSKELALVEILLTHNATFSAISLCRQICATAVKFKFVEIIIKTARILREQAIVEEDEKSFGYYNNMIEQYLPVLKAEVEAEQCYLEAREIYQSRTSRKVEIQKLESLANKLVTLSEKPDSIQINYYMFYVWVLYYETIQDYEGAIEVCSNAIRYLAEQKDYVSQRKTAVFSIKILSAYLHLGNYEGGKAHAEQTLTTIAEDTVDWIDFMEYYLLLSLKMGRIINGIAIFNKVANCAFFKKLDETRQEKWHLFEVTLYYLIEKEGTNPLLLPRQRRKVFKVSDFISRPVNYPQRLVLFALQRVIFQILFLLQRKSFPGISQRIEQLRKLTRYELKKEGYERAYAFVRLLIQLEKANYQPKNLKNTEKHLQQLQDIPFSYRGRITDLEVLPYEQLWEIIIKQLAS